MTSVPLDEIGAPNSGKGWRGEFPGDVLSGEITYAGIFNGLDFDQKVTQRKLRVDIITDGSGERRSLYAVLVSDITKPDEAYSDRMAKAIRGAGDAAGSKSLEAGGRLVIQRQADIPPTQPGRNPAYDYVAQYTPPAPKAPALDFQSIAAQGQQPAPNNVVQFPPQGMAAHPAQGQAPALPYQAPAQPFQAPAPAPQVAPQAAPVTQMNQTQLAAYLGVPETVLSVLTPEQLQAMIAQKAPAPGATTGLLAPPPPGQ